MQLTQGSWGQRGCLWTWRGRWCRKWWRGCEDSFVSGAPHRSCTFL